MSVRSIARPLRRSMVCLSPSTAELDVRHRITLTSRDKEILTSVHQLGFLTADLIDLAFFSSSSSSKPASSAAYERMRELWLWKFLDRVELPVARIHGGRQAYLYSLGPAGVPVVAQCLGESTAPVRRRRLDRLDDLFVDHDLRAAAFWANLKALTRRTGPATPYRQVRDFVWTSERDFRARCLRVREPETQRYLPVLPDGGFAVHYAPDCSQYALVEIDMGTMTSQRFRQKMRAFDLYLMREMNKQSLEARYGQVYVLTTSAQRMENLMDWTDSAVDEGTHIEYCFTTFDALEPQAFTAYPWTHLGSDNRYGLLFNRAHADDQHREVS